MKLNRKTIVRAAAISLGVGVGLTQFIDLRDVLAASCVRNAGSLYNAVRPDTDEEKELKKQKEENEKLKKQKEAQQLKEENEKLKRELEEKKKQEQQQQQQQSDQQGTQTGGTAGDASSGTGGGGEKSAFNSALSEATNMIATLLSPETAFAAPYSQASRIAHWTEALKAAVCESVGKQGVAFTVRCHLKRIDDRVFVVDRDFYVAADGTITHVSTEASKVVRKFLAVAVGLNLDSRIDQAVAANPMGYEQRNTIDLSNQEHIDFVNSTLDLLKE